MKTKIQTNRITIDDLGGMILRLETSINKRIGDLENKMEKRFGDLENRMDYRFNGVQNQLDNIYLNYTTMREHKILKERTRKIERKIGIVTLH
ncbi:MAG: hypothetical protein WC648_01495 [Candidatus Paceibacterota bacterium]|jgi:hypothetical protein